MYVVNRGIYTSVYVMCVCVKNIHIMKNVSFEE